MERIAVKKIGFYCYKLFIINRFRGYEVYIKIYIVYILNKLIYILFTDYSVYTAIFYKAITVNNLFKHFNFKSKIILT